MILFASILAFASCASPKPAVNVSKTSSQPSDTVSSGAHRLDHSKAFVKMTFEGLLLFSINEKRQMEIGALNHEHHKFEFQIRKITGKGSTIVNFPVDSAKEIRIEAVNQSGEGVSTYLNNDIPFNKDADQGDPEDFRWVIDFEGKEFHDRKLTLTNPEMLRPRIHINSGIFYTQKKSTELLGRVNWDFDSPWLFIGKAADAVGADIQVDRNNNEVVLTLGDKGSAPLRLKKEPGTRYEIVVRNERHQFMPMGDGADFRLWYNVLSDSSGKKFDIRRVEEYDVSGSGLNAPPASRRFLSYGPGTRARLLDAYPYICVGVFLGQTVGLE